MQKIFDNQIEKKIIEILIPPDFQSFLFQE